MKLKAIYCITFPAYNLLIRAESPIRLSMATGFSYSEFMLNI
ncbi:hypothetical protein [Leptospira noguchii]|nr:hypothetical protein [Leptospira noguchii]